MLDSNLRPATKSPAPNRPPPQLVNLAKWPPDDDMPGAPRGGGVPAGFDSGDGNFKKGRFAPMAILIGLLAVGGFAAFMLIGGTQDAAKLTIEQGIIRTLRWLETNRWVYEKRH